MASERLVRKSGLTHQPLKARSGVKWQLPLILLSVGGGDWEVLKMFLEGLTKRLGQGSMNDPSTDEFRLHFIGIHAPTGGVV